MQNVSVIVLPLVTLIVIKVNVIMPGTIALSVIMLHVIKLSVVVPTNRPIAAKKVL